MIEMLEKPKEQQPKADPRLEEVVRIIVEQFGGDVRAYIESIRPGELMNYRQYLASPDWAQFKEHKAETVQKRCSICASNQRVELHHLFYRHPWTETQLSDTRWLCRTCHQTAHDLIDSGRLKFPKPENHMSCYILTKHAVKKARGFGQRNMFT